MARITERLTTKRATAASAPGMYPDGDGLYLHVGNGGSKSWILRYRLDGRRHDIGLGKYPLFGVAAARERANERRRMLADKIDPLAAKRVVRVRPMTFAECAEKYIDTKIAGIGKSKSEAQWRASLTAYANPIIGSLPVAEVDRTRVMAVLTPIWRKIPETATRVRSRIEAVLDWAIVSEMRAGPNPAAWRGGLKSLLPTAAKVEHYPAMPHAEIAGFMAELRQRDTAAARALEFAVLTAARLGEVLDATWAEIDLEGRTWTVPAGRMKAGREHRVALSGPALAILAALPRDGDKVFAVAAKSTVNRTLAALRDGLTVHGFRSTFRDWCGENGVDRELAEHALAHATGNAVEAAYARADLLERRRPIMEAWARYCSGEGASENVVLLRAGG